MKKPLGEILTTKKDNPQEGNDCLLKLMYPLKFLYSFTVTGVKIFVFTFPFVTPDRVWVNDLLSNLVLTNTAGDILHHLKGLFRYGCGFHTVNSESEVIYIDRSYNIKKLSNDMKINNTFI